MKLWIFIFFTLERAILMGTPLYSYCPLWFEMEHKQMGLHRSYTLDLWRCIPHTNTAQHWENELGCFFIMTTKQEIVNDKLSINASSSQIQFIVAVIYFAEYLNPLLRAFTQNLKQSQFWRYPPTRHEICTKETEEMECCKIFSPMENKLQQLWVFS